MPYKYTEKSTLLALKQYISLFEASFIKKTNEELLKIINIKSVQSEDAKTLLVYRFLPKVLSETRKIFKNQRINYWNREDIIQTGIKALLYAIQDFLQKEKKQQTEALFTYIAVFYITKYLNRKKINYDPLIQFSKGLKFKKVFYKYFKVLKVLAKNNNNSLKICEKTICSKLNTDIKTLREVQYVHQQLSIIKSQEDQNPNPKNNLEGDNEESQNYIDYAMSNNLISEIDSDKDDPQNIVIKNETRNIKKYQNILSNVEYKLLDSLNSGDTKKQIINNLKISKQRFSYLTKNITKKINNFENIVY
tara:strand:- start:100 stop:1017 length:918 start_codon:yes stop_codon:yes gene_type:complete